MNTDKFTGKADNYAKYRPNYPKALYDYIYDQLKASKESTIADIGAGTGIFSKGLIERGSFVYCIEPNDEMRHKALDYLAEYNNCRIMASNAENTELDSNSIDLITVAQAFHWFDVENFKKECRRIIKKNQKVLLIWNSRVADSEVHKENEAIIEKYCSNFNGFSGGTKEEDARLGEFFDCGIYEYLTFENNQFVDLAGFVGGNLSASYAPKEGEVHYEKYIEEITDLFNKMSQDGILTLPMYTRMYFGNV